MQTKNFKGKKESLSIELKIRSNGDVSDLKKWYDKQILTMTLLEHLITDDAAMRAGSAELQFSLALDLKWLSKTFKFSSRGT